MIDVTCVYEDDPTYHVMLKMLGHFPDNLCVSRGIHCHGFGKIKKNIAGYNSAAMFSYFFVITDLDRHECAPSLIREWLPAKRNLKLIFRVAVREVESWLLADRENFARFFAVNPALVPFPPDEINDPKQVVFAIAKRSRKRNIREGIPPTDEYVSIGPGYNIEFRDFIKNYWSLGDARKNSPSLDKALKSLEKLPD
ncbi:MAG: DUF4276 family protein [Synergistaceae bacterium]|jgi:hypothetical protein|nr:DUF4276 family protein [Synergistaceae bacterium]